MSKKQAVFDDLISRQWLMECVIDGWIKFETEKDENTFIHLVRDIAPTAQPKVKAISYQDCQNALLKMWIDKVITDGEYRRIVDKLSVTQAERKE